MDPNSKPSNLEPSAVPASSKRASFSASVMDRKGTPSEPQKVTQIPQLEPPSGAKTTLLDSGSESDGPVSWGAMSGASILLSVCDDESDSGVPPINTSVATAAQGGSGRPRSKRSPNRDDSDSEDEDEQGNKLEKKLKDIEMQDAVFNPAVDAEYLGCGFKVGFAEDRNKRFRRTMEDSHTIQLNFADSVGSGNRFGVIHATGFFAVFDGHAGRAAADFCGENACKRVLYTANVGDARAILSRNGKASRLSYDHKGSDAAESRRVVETGGFMMNHRVNGVLAVTRSLGDLSMKEWVIGAPYTTETVLTENDTTLIIACDGIWDVCPDQEAVDMIGEIEDPQECADCLVDFALDNRSTDNLTAIVVKINPSFR
ncbi:Protein phosphatase 2C 1 [Kappamyces sp. JEL0829]|nr:Protein phosphatase 2C 1 [Kappamyces sp. JEL0829]